MCLYSRYIQSEILFFYPLLIFILLWTKANTSVGLLSFHFLDFVIIIFGYFNFVFVFCSYFRTNNLFVCSPQVDNIHWILADVPRAISNLFFFYQLLFHFLSHLLFFCSKSFFMISSHNNMRAFFAWEHFSFII